MSVTYPRGFRAAGVAAGLKPSGRGDLALLVAERPCAAAAVFTTNAFPAAPVQLSRSRLGSGHAHAVLVNSGQANAGTGAAGLADAEAATAEVAGALRTDPELVLMASTGLIGERLRLRELVGSVGGLVEALSPAGGTAFAEAIMTTDTARKEAAADAGRVRVGGCAKGVGMIAPDLATMLAFVTTDAALAPASARELVATVLAPVFEGVTVDGCTSTNDSVFLMASGAATPDEVEQGSAEWDTLTAGIRGVGASLAEQIVADAEGGTRVLVVEVRGAASDDDARRVAKAVAESPLVKTAAFGGDPNPGRILQAIGSSGAGFRPGEVEASIGTTQVIRRGEVAPEVFGDRRDAARAAMASPRVPIAIVLGDGPGESRLLSCDLSYDYVRINGEYTT